MNTLKIWLSILEASHQVVVLRPYYANVGKRLVKTPKAYFTDTGTLCYLSGLKDPGHAAAGPLGGAIFEPRFLQKSSRHSFIAVTSLRCISGGRLWVAKLISLFTWKEGSSRSR